MVTKLNPSDSQSDVCSCFPDPENSMSIDLTKAPYYLLRDMSTGTARFIDCFDFNSKEEIEWTRDPKTAWIFSWHDAMSKRTLLSKYSIHVDIVFRKDAM